MDIGNQSLFSIPMARSLPLLILFHSEHLSVAFSTLLALILAQVSLATTKDDQAAGAGRAGEDRSQ